MLWCAVCAVVWLAVCAVVCDGFQPGLIDLFHNDVKRGFQDDTRNLIGSAIMKVLFKPIKFRVTSRFPRLRSL